MAREAVVIGGGIVGTAAAIGLQRAGFATLLVDPQASPPPASWGNAGHIAVEQIEPLASRATLASLPKRLFTADPSIALPLRGAASWLPFAWRFAQATRPARFERGKTALGALMRDAMPAWRRFVAALGAPQILREQGHFLVWTHQANRAAARSEYAAKNGGTARYREAQSDEIETLTALMGRPPALAMRCLGSGHIADHADLFAACRSTFTGRGGRHRVSRAGLTIEAGRAIDGGQAIVGGRASVILEDGGRLTPDIILVSAGVHSAALMRSLGHRVPLIAERGYHLHSPGDRWPGGLPPVVFEEYALIVTRFRSGVRASSFLEFTSPDARADPAKWRRLRQRITALGLPFELPGEEWMGSRPTLPDYLPAIGRSRKASNVIYAFGHQHLGLTLAPVTAEAVVALIGGEASGEGEAAARDAAARLAAFDIARF
ncbi:MAG: FAD-dependent oxidoreductase [Steroidobacteraceae bacterium]